MSGTLDFDDILQLAERESGAYGLADAGLVSRAQDMVARFNARGPYAHYQIEGMRRQVVRMLSAG